MAVDLHQRRKELGLTMKQVADAVGVSEPTISRYESGNIRNMRRDRIDKYAKVLRVSLLDMIEDDDELRKEPTMKEVSDRLRSIRKSKGLKVADMTKLLNISDRGYRFYESGEREPNIECLIKICRILSVSADELLGITGDGVRGEAPGTIPEAARDHIMRRFCNTV